MAILGFGKKKDETGSTEKTPCSCGCQGGATPTDGGKPRFVVLGACCQKSADTFANVKQAVSELGFTDEVVNIGDAVEIVRFGVMQTPALAVDGKVLCSGKLIKVDEAKTLIGKTGIKP